MKIKRFDENMINEKLSKKVKDNLYDIKNSIVDDFLIWIENMSKDTVLEEYKNFTKNPIKFAEDKNLIIFKQYASIDENIEILKKEIETLKIKRKILMMMH